MKYQTREYPLFSACGLNCGLCPRYHTDGASKCPGCAGEGFSEKHPACGVLSCSLRKGVEFCYLCEEYPCKKYDGADLSDSFITHRNQFHDFNKAKKIGLGAYIAELDAKVELLEQLLKHYDDRRRKSFFCAAVNLLDLQDICSVMEQVASEVGPDAEQKVKTASVVRIFEEMAQKRNISLRLRKKSKSQ